MKTSADLGKDPVSSLVLRLAIPAMIAQFVNVLYSIIAVSYTHLDVYKRQVLFPPSSFLKALLLYTTCRMAR